MPTVGPKFVPVMITLVPIGPEEGFRFAMLGGGVTVNSAPLLGTLFTVTMTFPVVAPAGTVTLMLFAFQLEAAMGVPFKVTVLPDCVAPKFEPLIVKFAPTGP